MEAKFTADISDLKSKVDQVVSALGKTGNASQSMAKGVFQGILTWNLFRKALTEVVGFVKSSIASFAETETAVTSLGIAAKKHGIEWATMSAILDKEVSNALKNTTYSAHETTSALALLTNMGVTGAKATDMLRVAQDTAAARGLNLSDALSSIVKGSRGYTRSLIMLGINIDYVKNSSDKAAEITRQLIALYGGSAAAATDTYAGMMTRLTNNIEELKEQIAAQLIPQIELVTSQMLGFTDSVNGNEASQVNLQEKVFRTISGMKALWDVVKLLGLGFVNIGAIIGGIGRVLWAFAKDANEVMGNVFYNLLHPMTPKKIFDFSNVSSALGTVRDVWSELADLEGRTVEDLIKNTNAMVNGVGFVYKKIVPDLNKVPAGNAPDPLAKTAQQVAEEWKKARERVLDFNKQINKLVSDHKDAIRKMKADLEDLTASYKQSAEDRKDSFDLSIAGIIKSHQEKADDLKKQLVAETAFGKEIDEAKIADLKAELKKELDFLAKHASDAINVADEIAKDEIEIEKEKFAKENEQAKTEYSKKLADLQEQLDKENAAYDESLAQLGLSFQDEFTAIKDYITSKGSPEIVSAFQSMVLLANAELAKVDLSPLGTAVSAIAEASDAVTGLQTKIDTSTLKISTPNTTTPVTTKTPTTGSGLQNPYDMSKFAGQTISSYTPPKSWLDNTFIMGSLTSGFAKGGVVPRTGPALVHQGETVLPKGVSPNININFYGDMAFNNESDEDRLVEKMRKAFARDYEAAKLNIY
jgi:hypothetical protein